MQNQTLNCADAHHLVHLAVGDDALPDDEKQLTEHLHSCSECRAYHAGMMDAMQVLERVRDEDSVDIPAGAVWSAIADKVRSAGRRTVAPERRRFNGAVAALCACSLTLAVVTVIQSLPVNSHDAAEMSLPVQALNAGFPYGQNPQSVVAPRFVLMRQPDGNVVWVDRMNGQMYVPNLLSSLPGDQNLNF